MNQKTKFHALFLSGRESNYPRNDIIISALKKQAKLDVVSPKKKEISRGNYFQIFFQSLKGIIISFPKIIFNRYSIIFVGFFGQFIIIPISFISKTKIIFDFFLSAYDTMVNDRKVIKKNSLLSKLLFKLDLKSCNSADIILVDTDQNLRFYSSIFKVPTKKFRVLFVGCNEELFFPRQAEIDNNLVLYYSSYMPLHGVDVIIRSAKLLADTPIHFKIIGEGMEFGRSLKLVRELEINNISFLPPIPLSDLPNEISKAAICLGGHFGDTEKARRVIAGKTYQLLAMEKATIVGDNKANRELLIHGKDTIFCEMNNPESLAAAIRLLHVNKTLRDNIAKEGYKTFINKASKKVLQESIEAICEEFTHPSL
jgi:glycosyltransferase involved in cell wall biosynthesis